MTKYLSSNELHIRPQTRAALIWLLGKFKAGDIQKYDEISESYAVEVKNGKLPFNMGIWGSAFDTIPKVGQHWCGTVHCIGGWIELKIKDGMDDADHNRLYDLFFPQNTDDNYSEITVKKAERVLEKFLKTGRISWA